MTRSDTLRLAPPQVEAWPHRSPPHAGFEAQMAAAPGQRRGLREGRPAHDRARAAYLAAEWAGAHDRRPEPGLIRRQSL